MRGLLVMTLLLVSSEVMAQGIKPPIMSVSIGGSTYAATSVNLPGILGDTWRCPGPCAGSVVLVIITDLGPFRRIVVAVSNARAVGGSGGTSILQGLRDVPEESFEYTKPYSGVARYIGGISDECPLPEVSTFKIN
jgi:hypothetical protein